MDYTHDALSYLLPIITGGPLNGGPKTTFRTRSCKRMMKKIHYSCMCVSAGRDALLHIGRDGVVISFHTAHMHYASTANAQASQLDICVVK